MRSKALKVSNFNPVMDDTNHCLSKYYQIVHLYTNRQTRSAFFAFFFRFVGSSLFFTLR